MDEVRLSLITFLTYPFKFQMQIHDKEIYYFFFLNVDQRGGENASVSTRHASFRIRQSKHV